MKKTQMKIHLRILQIMTNVATTQNCFYVSGFIFRDIVLLVGWFFVCFLIILAHNETYLAQRMTSNIFNWIVEINMFTVKDAVWNSAQVQFLYLLWRSLKLKHTNPKKISLSECKTVGTCKNKLDKFKDLSH